MASPLNLPSPPAHDVRFHPRPLRSTALVDGGTPARAGEQAMAVVKRLAVHDWIALAYLTTTLLAVSTTRPGELRHRMIARHLSLLLLVLVAIVAARAERQGPSAVRALCYRAALVAAPTVSYLLLGEALPALNGGALDLALYRLDLRLFGFEPAMAFERYSSPALVDWFSLFYLGYFGLLAFCALPIVFFGKQRRLTGELAATLMLIYALGQTVYALVPAFGPRAALAGSFAHELKGGALYAAMNAIVDHAGAKKDIFPSLHTAMPVALAWLAFRHRRARALRLGWPVIAFVAANIVIATMFLRWHYLIDVVAGLALALGGTAVGRRIVDWELARRRSGDLGELWPAAAPRQKAPHRSPTDVGSAPARSPR